MDMARERISLILELMAMFLSFQMTFNLVTAAVVWAILESTSDSSDTIAPRHLKLQMVSSFLLSVVMTALIPIKPHVKLSVSGENCLIHCHAIMNLVRM